MNFKTATFAFLLITICLIIGSGISYAELEDGLVSAWTFDDGSAKDFQGGNDGEIKGGVEVVDGKFGKALSFNGSDGHVQIPHDESMEVIADGFTLAAWIQPRAGALGNSGILTKGEGTGWGIPFSFKVTLDWWGVFSAAGTEGYFNASGALNKPGVWVLACLTADGEQAIGYSAVEGGEVEIKPSGEGNPKAIAGPYRVDPDYPIEIGVGRLAGGDTDTFFNGIIDNVYFWDRPLTADEVAELASGAIPEGSSPVDRVGKLVTLWGVMKQQAQ